MSNHELGTNAITGKVVAASGTAAAVGSAAPTHVYGKFLTQNGVWLLSYAEWIQVIGAIYVTSLVIRTVICPVSQKILNLLRG